MQGGKLLNADFLQNCHKRGAYKGKRKSPPLFKGGMGGYFLLNADQPPVLLLFPVFLRVVEPEECLEEEGWPVCPRTF